MTASMAFREFIDAKRAENVSVRTVEWYATYLRPFLLPYLDKPLTELTGAHIRAHLAVLRTARRAEATLRTFYRAARGFLNWCWREYGLDPRLHPMRNVRLPAARHAEPKAASLDDIRRMLDACRDNTLPSLRDRAIILLLLETGCRAGGLVGLKRTDLHLRAGYATVIEKDRRVRRIYFTEPTALALRNWLSACPYQTEYVFVGFKPSQRGRPLTVSGLHQILKDVADRAGVEGRTNPHSLRHAFARETLRNGSDLATVAQMMGHTSVNTTASFYTVWADRELEERHRIFTPLKGLEGSSKGNGLLGDDSEG